MFMCFYLISIDMAWTGFFFFNKEKEKKKRKATKRTNQNGEEKSTNRVSNLPFGLPPD